MVVTPSTCPYQNTSKEALTSANRKDIHLVMCEMDLLATDWSRSTNGRMMEVTALVMGVMHCEERGILAIFLLSLVGHGLASIVLDVATSFQTVSLISRSTC